MAFIELSKGRVHYELAGPEAGPAIVLVHGVSIPMYSWDGLAPALVQRGFRVLRFDTYGRGQSAYPRGPYDRALLVQQMAELVDAVGLINSFNLVGFSFGGAMATQFASQYPSRVRKLALMAPYSRRKSPDPARSLGIPLVGELLFHFKARKALITRAQLLMQSAALPESHMQAFRAQAYSADFARAFVSLTRTDALGSYGPSLAAVVAAGIPSRVYWGNADEDIQRDSIDYLREHLQPELFVEIPGANHGAMLNPSTGMVDYLSTFFGDPAET